VNWIPDCASRLLFAYRQRGGTDVFVSFSSRWMQSFFTLEETLSRFVLSRKNRALN